MLRLHHWKVKCNGKGCIHAKECNVHLGYKSHFKKQPLISMSTDDDGEIEVWCHLGKAKR